MRKSLILTCLCLLPAVTGCSMSDALFSVFGDHYSGGGYTREEKEYHYNQQVEASRSYGLRNP